MWLLSEMLNLQAIPDLPLCVCVLHSTLKLNSPISIDTSNLQPQITASSSWSAYWPDPKFPSLTGDKNTVIPDSQAYLYIENSC